MMQAGVLGSRQGLGCRHPLPEKSRERLHAHPIQSGRRQTEGGRPTAPAPLLQAVMALTLLHKGSCWRKP